MALIASGRERPFTEDEILVSGTDRHGRIRFVNGAFVRVSGYSFEDLAEPGVLRHPGMPRAVGRVVGEGVRAGRAVAAYVRRLAKDGAQYWVMELSLPVADGVLVLGVKPVTEAFAAAREAYSYVRDAEVAVEDRDPRRREPAIEAGVERLSARLGDFEAFSRAAFTAEIEARPAPRSGGESARPARRSGGDSRAVVDAAAALLAGFEVVRERLARHGALSESLRRKSVFLVELAEEIRLFSLNAILAAHRVADSAAIGAVAGLLKDRSEAAAPRILMLGGEIEQAMDLLADTRFRVAAARLATEALLMPDGSAAVLPALADTIAALTDEVWTAMAAVDAALDRLADISASVEEHLKTFRFLELQGRIEAARASDTEHVRTLFEEIGRQVRAAGAELTEISALGGRRNRSDDAEARAASRDAAALRAAVSALLAR